MRRRPSAPPRRSPSAEAGGGLSDGCRGPGLDGDADRAGEFPADDLADLYRLLVEAGELRCALECDLLVGDLVAVDVVRATGIAESIPRQVLLELLHRVNVSHAHVENVKIPGSDATVYATEVRSAQGFTHFRCVDRPIATTSRASDAIDVRSAR